MNRFVLSLALVATAAFAASAHAQSAVITSHMTRPAPANVLGPKSTDDTASAALARSQVQSAGYSVRNLMRTSNGGWQGVALDRNSKPVVVALDSQGKVSEIR